MTTDFVILTLVKQTIGLNRFLRAAYMEASFSGKQPELCVIMESQSVSVRCQPRVCLCCDLGSGHHNSLTFSLYGCCPSVTDMFQHTVCSQVRARVTVVTIDVCLHNL